MLIFEDGVCLSPPPSAITTTTTTLEDEHTDVNDNDSCSCGPWLSTMPTGMPTVTTPGQQPAATANEDDGNNGRF